MFFGPCEYCEKDQFGRFGEDRRLYCESCWEFYNLQHMRCFTAAAIYNTTTEHMLAFGASINKCAEREALDGLSESNFNEPMTLVVCRIRRTHNGQITYGLSKPCVQCLCSLHLHGIS